MEPVRAGGSSWTRTRSQPVMSRQRCHCANDPYNRAVVPHRPAPSFRGANEAKAGLSRLSAGGATNPPAPRSAAHTGSPLCRRRRCSGPLPIAQASIGVRSKGGPRVRNTSQTSPGWYRRAIRNPPAIGGGRLHRTGLCGSSPRKRKGLPAVLPPAPSRHLVGASIARPP